MSEQICENCDRSHCPTLAMPDEMNWSEDKIRLNLQSVDYGWWSSDRNEADRRRTRSI